MGLAEYRKKRDFAVTPEPAGVEAKPGGSSFVIQKHAASHLHYDFRLEHEGVLKSWSVPKGPSFDPSVKRLAMATEDHPVSYGDFEGIIPQGEYGGGTVMVWDRGTWAPVGDPAAGLRKGNLKFELKGEKLRGGWALVRIRGRDKSRGGSSSSNDRSWLLVKERDEAARPEAEYNVTLAASGSVASGRSLEAIAADRDRVWHSNRAADDQPEARPSGKLGKLQAVRARTSAAPRSGTGGKKASSVTIPKAAPREKLPAFVSPQLATLVDAAPTGEDWLHEFKFDGFRVLARLEDGQTQLLTRSGQDWTARYPAVARATSGLPVKAALLDGEVTVVLPDGRTSFQALQNLGAGAGHQLVYFAFDLLHVNGHDLRPLPLEARKAILAQVIGAKAGGALRYTDHVVGAGPQFFVEASRAGLEGIIAKRRTEPYRSGRSGGWLKVKAVKRQEFVIGGFTPPSSGASTGIGALLVGVHDGAKLRYAGKVGTGFTQKSARELRERLDQLSSAEPPFSPAPKPRPKGALWVKPRLVAEVAFTEMTSDGKLRHPSFQGLREDKSAAEVTREVPQPAATLAKKPRKSTTVAPGNGKAQGRKATVTLTHPDRVLFPDANVTKQDLAAYYEAVADYVVPEVAGRPLTLVRCPQGAGPSCFFMKHTGWGPMPGLARVNIREQKKTGEYAVADSLEGLRGLVQMSVLEIHTWNATTAALESPDRVVFDLDPGPEVKWKSVVQAAQTVRERVKSYGFESFVKSTGGKGLHVVVPLVPEASWDSCGLFARLVAEAMAAEAPDRYTTAMSKAGRESKILIDHYRNHRGATSVAAYSTRAKGHAPVAAPLGWDEIAEFSPQRPFTVKTLPARLSQQRRDPWQDYGKRRKPLGDVLAALASSAPAKASPARRAR